MLIVEILRIPFRMRFSYLCVTFESLGKFLQTAPIPFHSTKFLVIFNIQQIKDPKNISLP